MKEPKILAFIPVYNEESRIGQVLERFPYDVVDEVIVADDGSTDRTPEILKKFNVRVIRNEKNLGIGVGMKKAIRYGIDNGFDIFVIMAGNGKDDPREVPTLLEPIVDQDYDYVQGSRHLKSDSYKKNTPFFRLLAVKGFTLTWRLLTGFPATDASNGFRAYKFRIFDEINVFQDWLDTYELEIYIYYLVIKKKFRIKEVPVSKDYPSKRNYTKIRPIIGWWQVIKPIICLKLGIKR